MSVRPNALLRDVVDAMTKLAPLPLADRSWDNVGVLVESPAIASSSRTVLVTIDLTPAVAEECLRLKAPVVVAYHPFIFSGLKTLTLRDPKTKALLQLAQAGVSVYTPHTALDACENGMNDWLCDLVGPGTSTVPIQPTSADNLALAKIALAPGAEVKTGFGRYRKLAAPTTLAETIQRVKVGTGVKAVRVAVPPHLVGTAHEAITIKDLAVCAGSGTSVFRALKRITPDLLLSGEMGHHDVLGAVQNGSIVILCEHTNSERGYLRDRLQPYLKAELPADVTVVCSEVDADPLVSF